MSHRAKSNCPKECPFVSKGGLKLSFALSHFHIDVAALVAADFGSHKGGFVDCLLKANAAKVYTVDTCYGTLDWSLRKDPRVVVFERTNAIHWRTPEPLDIVTIDVAWTKQEYIIPNAIRAIKSSGIILSLLKPQYESEGKTNTVMSSEEVNAIIQKTSEWLHTQFTDVSHAVSPYLGSGGNAESWFCLKNPIKTVF